MFRAAKLLVTIGESTSHLREHGLAYTFYLNELDERVAYLLRTNLKMIYDADLKSLEVRSQYVVPLISELIEKSGLADVDYNIQNLSTREQSLSSKITGTLFDDIAASEKECGRDHLFVNRNGNTRCQAEVSYELIIWFN